MKRSMFVLCGMLLALLLMPPLAEAQSPWGLPGWGWWSGIVVQNASATRAVIWAAALPAAPITPSPTPAPPVTPTPVGSYLAHQFDADNVGFGESVTLFPADFPGMSPGAFQGAGIINSTQPVNSIINLTNRRAGPYGITGGVAGGQYRAPHPGSAGANVLYFPVVKQQYVRSAIQTPPPPARSTVLFVQNISGRYSTHIEVSYTCAGGSWYYQYIPGPVYPGQTVVVQPAGVVPANRLCAATVAASGMPLVPIVGTSAEYLSAEAGLSVATVLQATRGLTSVEVGSWLYAPTFKKHFPTHLTQSRTTEAHVQNAYGRHIDNVIATYYGSSGACAGQSYSQSSGPLAAGTAASAVVYSTGANSQPILGIVSEMTYYDTLTNCYGQNQGQICYDRQNYEAFPAP